MKKMKVNFSCSLKKKVGKRSTYVQKIVRKLCGSTGKDTGRFE